jgi:hypothetical protein
MMILLQLSLDVEKEYRPIVFVLRWKVTIFFKLFKNVLSVHSSRAKVLEV